MSPPCGAVGEGEAAPVEIDLTGFSTGWPDMVAFTWGVGCAVIAVRSWPRSPAVGVGVDGGTAGRASGDAAASGERRSIAPGA